MVIYRSPYWRTPVEYGQGAASEYRWIVNDLKKRTLKTITSWADKLEQTDNKCFPKITELKPKKTYLDYKRRKVICIF